jgi:hypothetical protein
MVKYGILSEYFNYISYDIDNDYESIDGWYYEKFYDLFIRFRIIVGSRIFGDKKFLESLTYIKNSKNYNSY